MNAHFASQQKVAIKQVNAAVPQFEVVSTKTCSQLQAMSVYAISSAALSHLRPLVVNIVDQNVKEIRRSSNFIDSSEEQKHLNYIADVWCLLKQTYEYTNCYHICRQWNHL